MKFQEKDIKTYVGPIKIVKMGKKYIVFKCCKTKFFSFNQDFIGMADLVEGQGTNVRLSDIWVKRYKKVNMNCEVEWRESIIPQTIEVGVEESKTIEDMQVSNAQDIVVEKQDNEVEFELDAKWDKIFKKI